MFTSTRRRHLARTSRGPFTVDPVQNRFQCLIGICDIPHTEFIVDMTDHVTQFVRGDYGVLAELVLIEHVAQGT